MLVNHKGLVSCQDALHTNLRARLPRLTTVVSHTSTCTHMPNATCESASTEEQLTAVQPGFFVHWPSA